MSKPNIFATCKAGCLWETVHKSDFEKSACAVALVPNEDGLFILEKGKTYKIKKVSKTGYGFSLYIREREVGSSSTSYGTQITLPTEVDKYEDYFKIRLLDTYETGTYPNNTRYALVEFEGIAREEIMTYMGIPAGTQFEEPVLVVRNATECLWYNADATMAAEKVYVRYSANADGTDFTRDWNAGQNYIGITTGTSEPSSKLEFTWMRIADLVNIVQEEGSGTSVAMSQAVVTRLLAEKTNKTVFEEASANLENKIEQKAGGISKNSKRITNLERRISPDLFVEDNTIAYIKDVTSGALPYAGISKIGGMTKKCTNIFPPTVDYGWLCDRPTLSEDGKYTFTRNASGGVCYFQTKPIYLEAGKTYTLRANYTGVSHTYFVKQSGDSIVATLYGLTKFTPTESGNYFFRPYMTGTNIGDTASVYLWINEGDADLSYEPYFEGLRNAKVSAVKSLGANLANLELQTATITPEIEKTPSKFSMTVNSAATIYFRLKTIPVEVGKTYTISGSVIGGTSYGLYLHNATDNPNGAVYGNLMGENSKVTFTATTSTLVLQGYIKWASETAEQKTMTFENIILNKGAEALPFTPYGFESTFEIPQAMQNLDGYGVGINDNCYNYIYFEKEKQFAKCASKVDMGGLNWYAIANIGFGAAVPSLKNGGYGKMPNLITAPYKTTTACGSADLPNKDDKSITTDFNSNTIYVKDSNYKDISTFKDSMLGVMLVYELATPETEDISDIITSDNLIGVEGGGTITFVNEYEYDVPSEIVYQIEEVTE